MSKVVRVPAVRTMTLFDHFELTAVGLKVTGRPSFEEYEACGQFINQTYRASGFWLGDFLKYGESRDDFRERLSQAQDSTGLSEKRLKNLRAVAGKVDPSRRRDDMEFAMHEEVSSLPAVEQELWLERAHTEGWGQRDLRQHIRAAKRPRIIDGQAYLEGMYRVWYADPPWLYRDSGATADGSLGKAERHYNGMTVEDICKLPVEAHAAPDAVLFLWVTSPMLPEAFQVIPRWGFTYKSSIVWDKVLGNYGHYVHVRHELLLIATRGKCTPDVPTPSPDSVQTVRRSEEHSAKPEEFRKLIDQLYPHGRRVELFSRRKVEGWDAFGNDARLWTTENVG